MVHVTWTGAAGLRFDTGESLILIDPYYTRVNILTTLSRPIQPDAAAIDAMLPDASRVAAVVVGHTHSDHALDVPHIVERCPAKLVGSRSLDTLMTLNGMPGRTTICDGGETIRLTDGAAVTMIRSSHGRVAMGKVPFEGDIRTTSALPMKASGYRVGTVFAPKLVLAELSFIHIGSAGFIEAEMAGHRCDVLFLCVPGWKRTAGYPDRMIELTQPRTVVLFHFDDFSRARVQGRKTRRMPMIDMQGLVRRIKARRPDIELVIPQVGEPMHFSRDRLTT